MAAKAKPEAEIVTRAQLEAEETAKRETQEREAVTRRAEARAEEERQAARPRLARDAERQARDQLERTSIVSELPEFRQVLEAVADEEAAKSPRGEPPVQAIAKTTQRIITEVKRRLAESQERLEAEKIRAEEAKTTTGRREQAKEAKVKQQAKAETGQKKERAGAKKGKSAEGIRAESPESVQRAYEKELKKKPEERERLLLAWGQLQQEAKRKETTPERKEEIKGLQAQLQELRATKAEAAAAEPTGPSARSKAVGKTVEGVLEAQPIPALTGTGLEQTQQLRADMKKFYKDVVEALKAKGQTLSAKHSSTHNTMAENLAIYARKVLRKDEDVAGHGGNEWGMARIFYNAKAEGELYNLTTNETLRGTGDVENRAVDDAAMETRARHEDETETTRRRVREEEAEAAPSPDEEALLRRRGRALTLAQREAQVAREERGYEDFRPLTVTRPNGQHVTVQAETRKASSVLRELGRTLRDTEGGFVSILRNAHIRHLIQLVGDVDVHFVSPAAMRRLTDEPGVPQGLYYNYTDEMRSLGFKPQVFISEDTLFDSDAYTHTVLHELTHAATSQAIRANVRGTRQIISRLRLSLEKRMRAQFTPQQLADAGLKYGFKNDAEFIAEAFSNPEFQKLLGAMTVPSDIRRDIGALGRGRPPTFWEAVTAAVSNAIGMISGTRGQTYMEQVLALSPHLTRSVTGQQRFADEETFGRPQRKAVPSSPLDEQALSIDAANLFQSVKDKLTNAVTPDGRRKRDIFATTGEHIRRSVDLFGGPGNVLEKLGRIHLMFDPLRRKLRKNPGAGLDSEKLETDLIALKHANPAEYRELGDLFDQGTRHEVDMTVPITHANNGHLVTKQGKPATGARVVQARAMHPKLAARWAKLSPQTQKVGRETIAHMRKAGDLETDKFIEYSVGQALKAYRKKLPAGKSMKDAIAWVRGPGPTRAVADQTADDKAFHDALGKTALTLAKVPELKRVRGLYVPLTRRGKYLITATAKVFDKNNLPKGAVLDADAKTPLEKQNRLLFMNRADYDAFAASHPGQVSVTSRWIDPYTGKKIAKEETYTRPDGTIVYAKQMFVATVQNKYMEMSDSKAELVRRGKELHAAGYEVSDIRSANKDLHRIAEEISSAQIKGLLNNLAQTTVGHSTIGQEAIKGVVLDAHIRTLMTPGQLQRRMKRRGVLGSDTDLFQAVREYNTNLAGHLTNLELAPQMAEADTALQKFIDTGAHPGEQRREYTGENLTLKRQAVADEMRNRIAKTNYASGPKFLSAVKDVTYLRHLASPHYTIIQLTQPFMMTLPVLSAKYGRAAAWKYLLRAYFLGGSWKTLGIGGGVFRSLGRGGLEVGKATVPAARAFLPIKGAGAAGTEFSHDDHWRNVLIKGQPDEAQLAEVFDEIVTLGFGASSGIEAQSVSEADKGRAGVALGRMVTLAKALPEAAESINRYTTATAAYRLARDSGKGHEAAKREAVLTVEETQGGYGAANNPAFFSNPYLNPAVQFRKFGLAAGQLFYRNLAHWASHQDAEIRKQSRKTVTRLALTTVVMAGAYGVPLVEIARHLVNVAAMLGFKEDDWEQDEIDIQRSMKEAIEAVTNDTFGEWASEALTRGLPRTINLDLSGSLGTDNLFLFGQPKDVRDKEDVAAWLFNALGGAPGGVFFNAIEAIAKGDPDKLPWPKIVQNIRDAYGLMTKGVTDRKTGESYTEPVGIVQSVYKATGFRTATEARQWETGSGVKAREERKLRSARRDVMARARNADPAEKRRLVKEWNASHKKRDERIDMGDLFKSKRQHERRRKELEEED